MDTERREIDHPIQDRKKVSILRRPEKPTIWSLALSTKELVFVLSALLLALGVILKFGSEFHWRFWAQEKVDAEVQVYTVPIVKRLEAHESAFVTKADYAVHLEQEVRDREAIRTWLGAVGQRVDFIYQEAYRSRFGSAPPRSEIGPEAPKGD